MTLPASVPPAAPAAAPMEQDTTEAEEIEEMDYFANYWPSGASMTFVTDVLMELKVQLLALWGDLLFLQCNFRRFWMRHAIQVCS